MRVRETTRQPEGRDTETETKRDREKVTYTQTDKSICGVEQIWTIQCGLMEKG